MVIPLMAYVKTIGITYPEIPNPDRMHRPFVIVADIPYVPHLELPSLHEHQRFYLNIQNRIPGYRYVHLDEGHYAPSHDLDR